MSNSSEERDRAAVAARRGPAHLGLDGEVQTRRIKKLYEDQVRSLERRFPGRLIRDGKVTEGRDGWLFLDHDGNDVMGQHAGRRPLSEAQLEEWRHVLERRSELLAEIGAKHVFFVAPDTHSVYPEKLPEGAAHVEDRPVRQLLAHLREKGSDVSVVYPLEQMLEAKRTRLVCAPNDSHWTEYGGFVGYRAFVDELGEELPIRRVVETDMLFTDEAMAGDLGVKVDPVRVAHYPFAAPWFRTAIPQFDNCVENIGSVVVSICPEAPDTTCVAIGDSYVYAMMKPLSETFGRVVCVHLPTLDIDLVRDHEPDVVITFCAERFLVEVPRDSEGPTHAEVEHRKRAESRNRPPFVAWMAPHQSSPYGIERMRARLLRDGGPRDAAILSLLAFAALRPRELLHLRWGDVGDGQIYVRGKPGPARRRKATGPRTVRLLGPVADDLEALRRESRPSGPRRLVFPGPTDMYWHGGEWSKWSESVLLPAARAAGVEVEKPTDLGAIFMRLLLREGLTAKEVSDQMGIATRTVWSLKWLYLRADGTQTISADEDVRRKREAVAWVERVSEARRRRTASDGVGAFL